MLLAVWQGLGGRRQYYVVKEAGGIVGLGLLDFLSSVHDERAAHGHRLTYRLTTDQQWCGPRCDEVFVPRCCVLWR